MSLKVEYFTGIPHWSILIESGEPCRLYLPHSYNYPAIDGAILQLDRTKKTAHLFLIQVTLAKKHKDSEKLFYEKCWGDWTEYLADFQVQSTFVWIDRVGPSENTVRQQKLVTRTRTILLNPQYTSIHVAVADVDQRLVEELTRKTK